MAVDLRTTHYRFGVNSGTESSHGWHANEDANPAQGVIAVDTTFLLRFTVQETGGTAAGNVDQQFQVAKNGGAFQDITTTSSIVKAVTTAVFANGADLTQRLSGTGTFESSADGGTHDGLSGGPQNDIAASGNSETECALQIISADVVHGDVLTFRLTSPDFTITNNVVPTLTVAESSIVEADGSIVGAAALTGATAAVTAATASLAALAGGQAAGAMVAGATGAISAVAAVTGEGADASGPVTLEADGAITAVTAVTGAGGAIWLTSGAIAALAADAWAAAALVTTAASLDATSAVTGLSSLFVPATGAIVSAAVFSGTADAPGGGGGNGYHGRWLTRKRSHRSWT